jgi:YtkA-like protein
MRMPGMTHDATTTMLRAAGTRRYEGTVTFEMAGSWELTLLVGAPAREASATFVVQP